MGFKRRIDSQQTIADEVIERTATDGANRCSQCEEDLTMADARSYFSQVTEDGFSHGVRERVGLLSSGFRSSDLIRQVALGRVT